MTVLEAKNKLEKVVQTKGKRYTNEILDGWISMQGDFYQEDKRSSLTDMCLYILGWSKDDDLDLSQRELITTIEKM